ncbi:MULTISPECIES: 2OG-Fe(II) oxygenase family protein [unclassified Novosphingobium]|uniref:2OG-Fe(II) oxygenase family protein n=1 Tax=unclassified Novosphingobium TaxID=2644732 RepID=UPI0025F83215|nr:MULTISPECIES: 2OG-Fe(II) oxygenase family protein [unclassified Novosphingobium]HQV04698.1 2OG-Fe(II) oxygenase family protein [Novosphingobium sp.]
MLILACPGLAGPLQAAYAEFGEMVHSDDVLPGPPETPPGALQPDPKRYLEFAERATDVPLALVELRRVLIARLDVCARALEEVTTTRLTGPLSLMMDRCDGPVLRMTWYPPGYVGEVNQPHTDIDLFTILPAATQPGLQRRAGDQWLPIAIGKDEVAVMTGEILQELGVAPAIEHRVLGSGQQRMSVSLFVNADPDLVVRQDFRAGDLMKRRFQSVRQVGT